MTKPRYQDVVSKNIPEIIRADGIKIRVIAGHVGEVKGAVTDIFADPDYLDVTLPPHAEFTYPIAHEHTAFAYMFDGEGKFENGEGDKSITAPRMVIWGEGDQVVVKTALLPARFLLVSGKPLGEPIARYGPFVMNTREEILQAIQELQNGTFVKD